MKKTKVINLIILDESGSMEPIREATMTGFRELMQMTRGIQKQFPGQAHIISFVTFNSNGINHRIDFQPLSLLDTDKKIDYRPNALTPLYDGIGVALLRVKNKIEFYKNARVLVTILTDGLENASKEFNRQSISELINQLKGQGWTFTFMGTDFDVKQVSTSININNSISFKKTFHGVYDVFEKEKKARTDYCKSIYTGEEDTDGNYYKEPEL